MGFHRNTSYLISVKDKLSTCVLGSSSAGNSTVIWNAKTTILIDCGLGPVYLTQQLEQLGLRIQELDAVFVTHIHGDHVKEAAVRTLVKLCIPIYCPPAIAPHLRKKYKTIDSASKENLLNVMKKSEVDVDTFSIRAFEVPHDSDGGCFGYSVFCTAGGRTKKVSVATDMAHLTKSALGHLVDSDILVIESNYDDDMLEQSDRSEWLKDRIRDEGHLSNDQCAASLLQIFDRSQSLPKNLALAHVSQQCNTNELAHACTGSALDDQGIREILVHETHPRRASDVMAV